MTIYVYVDTYVTGMFKISYGKFGPTEARAIAVIANALFFFWGFPAIDTAYGTVLVYDIFVSLIAIVLVSMYVVTTTRRARELSKLEKRA
jgi:hypothetical protein